MTTTNFQPVILKYKGNPDSHKYDFYVSHGGYNAAKKALSMNPADITDLVKKSGLRGKGGAGFSAGQKWSYVSKDVKPVYLAINADEGEPGTFKDKYILQYEPHMLIEGIIISSIALQSNNAFLYIRGEFYDQYIAFATAVEEAYKNNCLGKNIFGSNYNLDISITRGAGSYVCGEATTMLSSIEGGRGNPRVKPPRLAQVGLWGKPTIVNNVETIAQVPPILENGPDWYRQWGTKDSPGFLIVCLSGDINKPGIYEMPFGVPINEIINNYGGGVSGNRKIKAVIPGGSSTPFLLPTELDTPLSYEDLWKIQSSLGTAAITVLDETRDILDCIYNLMRFYHHESCGQCTPCREGTGWIEKIMRRIVKGEGKMEDLETLERICHNMSHKTICELAEAAALPLESVLKKFHDDFVNRIQNNKRIA